jgi:hypothetical protein
VLELIVSGRTSEQNLRAVMRRTLWVYQHEPEVFGIDDDYMERVEQAVQWLYDRGFVERSHRGLDVNELGQAAVDYGLRKFGRYQLAGVKKMYDWIRQADQLNYCGLFRVICEGQDISLYESDDAQMEDEFAQELRARGLSPQSDYDVTALILSEYWLQNRDIERTANVSGYRAEYTQSVALKVGRAVTLCGRLIDMAPDTSRPDDWDTVKTALKNGVARDEARLVNEVRGLGRQRVRGVSEMAANMTHVRPGFEDADLKRKLEMYETARIEDSDNAAEPLENKLKEDVEGVFKTLAPRICEVLDTPDVPEAGLGNHTD